MTEYIEFWTVVVIIGFLWINSWLVTFAKWMDEWREETRNAKKGY